MDFEAKKKKKSCKPLFHRNPQSGRCVKNMTAEQRRLASRRASRQRMLKIRSNLDKYARYREGQNKDRMNKILVKRFGTTGDSAKASYAKVLEAAREQAAAKRKATLAKRRAARKATVARVSGYEF